MAKLWQFSQGHRKPSFSEKVQRGEKGNFSQMSLSSNLYQLIVKRPDKILACNAAPNVPEWPSYGNFRKVTQNPHFLKKCKGGTKGNFSKIAQKVALVWKAPKHSGANGIILLLVCTKVQRLDKILAHKAPPKVPEWPSYGNFRQVTQTRIF